MILNIAMLAIICSVLTLFLWFFLKFKDSIGLFSQIGQIGESTIADYARDGGIARVAKAGEKQLLGDIIKRVLSDSSGGISDMAMALIPDIDDWVERNPYAILRLIQNPGIQRIIKQFRELQIASTGVPTEAREGVF